MSRWWKQLFRIGENKKEKKELQWEIERKLLSHRQVVGNKSRTENWEEIYACLFIRESENIIGGGTDTWN
jgi:hypothetical protein